MTDPAAAPAAEAVRLGLAVERPTLTAAALRLGVEAAADELGWPHRQVADAADEADCDLVLAIGDPRAYPDLLRRPTVARRVLWYGEPLPRPMLDSGGRLHRVAPSGRILDVAGGLMPGLRRSGRFLRWRERAAMVREPIANLRLLKRVERAFDRIVLDATDRAEGALGGGLPVAVVPFGYHTAFAGPLDATDERPIDILLLARFIGRYGRRQRIVGELERHLEDRGLRLVKVTHGSYGARRRDLLRRARVVVDIHRMPGNHPGFRFLVAAAAGAVLLSEPLHRPEPLEPGVHYLEAPSTQMAQSVADLLADEPRRLRIVEAAQSLLASELHMRNVLPRLVAAGMGS